jgi:hypothetical protein
MNLLIMLTNSEFTTNLVYVEQPFKVTSLQMLALTTFYAVRLQQLSRFRV